MNLPSQKTGQSTRLHGVDVDRVAGKQDGNLLAHGDGIAGLGELQVLFHGQSQVIGLVEPPRMQRQSQILSTGGMDLGPNLGTLVGFRLSGKAHVDSCQALME